MFDLKTPINELPFPVQRLSDEARELWLSTYADVFAQTSDETKAEMGAWGAINRENVLRKLGMKSVDGRTVIGGWSNLYTNKNERDLLDTFFNEKTEYALEYYQNAPLLYEHDAKFGIIGKRIHTEVFPHGIWMEHELHADSPHYGKVVSELEQGVLYYSTDSIAHVVAEGYEPEDGYLGLWFLAGCSLTKNPAEPALGPVTLTGVVQAIKSAREMRKVSADEVTPTIPEEEIIPMQEAKMPTLQEIALMIGLSESATAEEVVTQLQSLDSTAQKMDGMTDEEKEQASKSIETLNKIAAALTVEGVAPSTEELRAMLTSALESLGVEIEEEVAVVDPVMQAKAAKSVYESFKNSTAPVTQKPIHAVNREKQQSGLKMRNSGGNGFGTPIAKKSASTIITEGLIAMAMGDAKKLHNLGYKRSSKSLGYQEGVLGGWLPDRAVSTELIQLFYANTAVLNAGATVVPMDGIETMIYRKMLSGGVGRWAAAGQTNTSTDQTFGMVELTLRQATAESRLSNRLIKNTPSLNLENMIMRDLEQQLSLLVDLSALRGSGAKPAGSAGRELLGVRNTTGVTVNALTSAGRTPTTKDFVDAWGRIQDANVPASSTWKHIMHPRTNRIISNTTDVTGRLIPIEQYTQGYDVLTTTQVPITLSATTGGAVDCSEIYFGDWQYLIVGMGQDIEFRVDTSRFIQEDETYIRADMMVDVAVSHAEAFEVLTNVRP